MNSYNIPETIPNWINGVETAAVSGATFSKLSPHSGKELCRVARSEDRDVKAAIQAARNAQTAWAEIPRPRSSRFPPWRGISPGST